MFKNTTQTSRLNAPENLSWNKAGSKKNEEISYNLAQSSFPKRMPAVWSRDFVLSGR